MLWVSFIFSGNNSEAFPLLQQMETREDHFIVKQGRNKEVTLPLKKRTKRLLGGEAAMSTCIDRRIDIYNPLHPSLSHTPVNQSTLPGN